MTIETSPHDTSAAAEAACIFGYPIVLMERTRVAMSGVTAPQPATMRAPLNRLVHASAPTAENAGMLSSSAWLDVGAEPVLLSVPVTHGHYYVASLIDMWTDEVASLGASTTGTGAGSYAIGGPGWDPSALPEGIRALTAATSFVRLSILTRAGVGAGEVQTGFEVRGTSERRETPEMRRTDATTAPCPREHVEGMDGRAFFAELARLVASHPPAREHEPALETARRLGLLLAPDGWAQLGGDLREAVDAGVARGLAGIRESADALLDTPRGDWRLRFRSAHHGLDFARRAASAFAGTPATDELRAVLTTDANGAPLSGRHPYLLRFAADALPPVAAFWSLCARSRRDGESSRHMLGNPDGLALDGDGSLRVHIQSERPSALRSPNWLRTPPGAFDLVLRLFWPADDALRGRWTPPSVTREA